ncbi:MAG: hypothetical protein M0R39_08775 [Prolixibacteraceae bacterium]|nr:hypothetical protein [Prolixibacteraceae bacterium]
MAKILLSKNYRTIVLKGLLLPEKDVIKYYTKITTKHLSINPDLFKELKNVISEYIEWYKAQARGGTVPVEMPDGSIKYFDKNQTWEGDGDSDYTKWVKHDLFEQTIFLLPSTSIKNVRVNKSFFENHLRIIEHFESQEKIKEIERNILEKLKTNLENVIQKRAVSVLQLNTDLKTDQIKTLFELLVKGEFIPANTDPDSFKWIFGDPEHSQPDQLKPITWNKSKWLLSYFVDVFNCEILGNDGNNKRTQWKPFEIIFGQNGLRGAKNDYQKTGVLPAGNEQINDMISNALSCK